MRWLAMYALGIGTAAAAKAVGPAVGRALRPAARTVIKQGLIIGQEVQRLTEEASASLGDLTSEAREEVEARPRRGSARPEDGETGR